MRQPGPRVGGLVEASKHGRSRVSLAGMNADLYYTPKLLQVGEFKEAFQVAVDAVLGSDAQISVDHPRHTGRAGVRGD